MKRTYFIGLLFCILSITTNAQNAKQGFKVIPLGIKGGLDESNLSAYLVAANGTDNYICLDAGTISAGLQKIANTGDFLKTSAEEIQRKNIKAYFISHGHLDHLAGLILNSPNDLPKPIYAFPSVIDVLKNHYFTWKSWANFGSEGDKPILNKYTYQSLNTQKEIEVPATTLSVSTFSLSHVNPYESSAFLVRNDKNYLLYLGDTGADSVEKSNKLGLLWITVAPLIKNKQLSSIFIEVSFDNSVPEKSLFGHLTPKLLMQELNRLNVLSGRNLKNTKIYITHIKPCSNCEQNIKKQIADGNNIGLQFFYPEQGKTIVLN